MSTNPAPAFPDFAYERPDLERAGEQFRAVLDELKVATALNDAIAAMEQIDSIRSAIASAQNISYIRHSIDTRDEFYKAEKAWFDQHGPATEAWRMDYYRALIDHPLRTALAGHFGEQLFRTAEQSLKTFQPAIIEDLQAENKAYSEYMQLKGGASIELDGETYNLSSIIPHEQVADRAARRRASRAKWDWMAGHQADFERIYDELVALRAGMATKLHYDDYVGLGYDLRGRADYGPEQVANFRAQVRKHIVPLATRLAREQADRIGVDRLHYYDVNFRFPDGNPTPQGDQADTVAAARRLYDGLSSETGSFFRFLEDRQLMDLASTDGKATGGYCTYVPDYGTPYIFANFNGTSHDVDVLTHEFGHAFQVYNSRHLKPLEYLWPTYDAAEIHSMSMEFFAYPGVEDFFGPDAQKYFYNHLAGAIRFLPYGCAVDEFQHLVYEHPEWTPAERNAAWKDLEATYLPHLDYSDHDYLKQGTYWQSQLHIFGMPFYYIDYCLAQICALQFWLRDEEDHAAAWRDYVRLCQTGGSRSFLELVDLAGLADPFTDGIMEKIARKVTDRLAELA